MRFAITKIVLAPSVSPSCRSQTVTTRLTWATAPVTASTRCATAGRARRSRSPVHPEDLQHPVDRGCCGGQVGDGRNPLRPAPPKPPLAIIGGRGVDEFRELGRLPVSNAQARTAALHCLQGDRIRLAVEFGSELLQLG